MHAHHHHTLCNGNTFRQKPGEDVSCPETESNSDITTHVESNQQHSDPLTNGDTCVILLSATAYQYISDTLPVTVCLHFLSVHTYFTVITNIFRPILIIISFACISVMTLFCNLCV